MPAARRPYPSKLTDAEWAVLEPLLPVPVGRGRPPKWPRRQVADAIFYLVRSGCAWRMLPQAFPPWQTVFSQFRRWRLDGTLLTALERLRDQVRLAEGREPHPSGAVIDSQTVKCTGVGGPERGYDGAKRAKGRKRHVLVDTAGLILLACVHAADLHDRLDGQRLIESTPAAALPRLELVWADGAYTGTFARWLANARGWRVEVPRHPDATLALWAEGKAAEQAHRAPTLLGCRAHLRLAWAVTASQQGLRTSTHYVRDDDLYCYGPHHAAQVSKNGSGNMRYCEDGF